MVPKKNPTPKKWCCCWLGLFLFFGHLFLVDFQTEVPCSAGPMASYHACQWGLQLWPLQRRYPMSPTNPQKVSGRGNSIHRGFSYSNLDQPLCQDMSWHQLKHHGQISLLSPPKRALPQVTTDPSARIQDRSERTTFCSLNLLHTCQVTLDGRTVTTSLCIPPTDYWSICQDSSKCVLCGLNLLHTYQLTLDRRTVTIASIAPALYWWVSHDRSKCSICGRNQHLLHDCTGFSWRKLPTMILSRTEQVGPTRRSNAGLLSGGLHFEAQLPKTDSCHWAQALLRWQASGNLSLKTAEQESSNFQP